MAARRRRRRRRAARRGRRATTATTPGCEPRPDPRRRLVRTEGGRPRPGSASATWRWWPATTSPSTIRPTAGPFELVGRHGSMTSAEMLVPLARSPSIGCADARRDPGSTQPETRRSRRASSSESVPADATATADVERRGRSSRRRQGHADRLDDQAAPRGGRADQARRAGREQLHDIYRPRSPSWRSALSPDLRDELDRLALAFDDDDRPERGRAAGGPGPAGRLARGPVPRHPGHAVRPADGRPPAARGHARTSCPRAGQARPPERPVHGGDHTRYLSAHPGYIRAGQHAILRIQHCEVQAA